MEELEKIIKSKYLIHDKIIPDFKKLETIFEVRKKINFKWESTKTKIICDIYKIIDRLQEEESEMYLKKVKEYISKPNPKL